MATPMTPAQWRTALKAEGVRFTEYDGWTTRGRDTATGKTFGPVHGVLNHHTAGTSSLKTIATAGRPGLPAPLAHAYLPKTGALVLVADGRANHAGYAARNSYDAIVAEKPIPKPSKASGTVDGNDSLYGIEVENLGDLKDAYTRAQYDTLVRFNAAICRHHGWGSGSVAGHLETSVEGKVDPRGPVEGYGTRGRFNLTMAQLRADVAERLKHPASWNPSSSTTTPKPSTEASVSLSADDIKKLATAVLTLDGVIDNPNPGTAGDNPYITLETAVRNIEIVARRTEAKVDQILAALHPKES